MDVRSFGVHRPGLTLAWMPPGSGSYWRRSGRAHTARTGAEFALQGGALFYAMATGVVSLHWTVRAWGQP